VADSTCSAEQIDAVMRALQASRRYRTIDAGVLRRLAADALYASDGRLNPAIKHAKRQLHQAFGAYWGAPPQYGRLLCELRGAAESGPVALRACLRRVMAAHASSRERLPILDQFYGEVFARIGRPRSIIDLACGLNPLAAPWMDYERAGVYYALDIDANLIQFLREALTLLQIEHQAMLWDAVAGPPHVQAKAALLLKTLPCLEQQRPGSGLALLKALDSPIVVVSFPSRSLGGRQKGMRETYARWFEAEAGQEGWGRERLDFAAELVYIVRK